MLLTVRFLKDVANVNTFEYAGHAEMFEGDAQIVYFQLIDATLDQADEGFWPIGRRYMPPALTTLGVNLGNIDDAKKLAKTAFQPFAQDPSIWAIQVLSTDPIRGTVSMRLTLTEPTRVLNSLIQNGLAVRPVGAS